MNMTISESIWLNDHGVCSAQHLVDVSGLSKEELDELIEMGVIVPMDEHAQPQAFQLRYIVTANAARRLRDDFELDRNGVALALTLMRRINDLQEELSAMRARLNHGISGRE
jgi:chaperone modulatory protein CbpM